MKIEKKKEEVKQGTEEVTFSAYALRRGESSIHYRLIRLHMKGKTIEKVELVLEEILPIVIAKAGQLMRQEGLQ